MAMKVVVELSDIAWRNLPTVAKFMDIACGSESTAELASKVFEALLQQASFEVIASVEAPDDALQAAGDVLKDLLEPDVRLRGLTVSISDEGLGVSPMSLIERFDVLAASDQHDPWIMQVLSQSDDIVLWKAALAQVYQAIITREDRKKWETWVLVERTFRMLKQQTSLDNVTEGGHNGPTSSPDVH